MRWPLAGSSLCRVNHLRMSILINRRSLNSSIATDSHRDPELTNTHYSLDPEGKPVMDLTFTSEPLCLPGKDGYGWPQLEFNETLGPDSHYVVLRKLGWGMSSSTWLARDKEYVCRRVLASY